VYSQTRGADRVAFAFPVNVPGRGAATLQIEASLPQAAFVPPEARSAQIAILCLALAAMLLLLRHARYRFKQYEQAQATNRELRQMQSQLVQSEKLASIGQLAAGVAHEMNTPLGFVACNIGTLETYTQKIVALLDRYDALAREVESANEQQRQALEQINQAKKQMRFDLVIQDLEGLFQDSREGLEHVTHIIQNLRDFSRIDQVGELAKYNINDGIAATLTVADNKIKQKAIVATELGQLPEVLCHPGPVNQVFLNILVNAVQALESQDREGPGHITIRTWQADEHVVCEIEDDGPGIKSDDIRKVFDPFYTTRPAGKGVGLGLSVAYDIIVNKHKGQLSVESHEGQGTKLTIKLPLTPAQTTQDEPQPMLIGAETNG
jgi:signal transduction histidine kinase